MNLKLPVQTNSRRLLTIGLVAFFVFMGLFLANMALAETANAIIVNSNADQEKKNDGICTLREAVIAANSASNSGGKQGECKLPAADANGGYTILLDESQIVSHDPAVPKTLFQLTRTDNGNEDVSKTGDLDINVPITVTTVFTNPVVIEGDPGFTDRIFHVLENGNLTIDRVSIRSGSTKNIGGGILVETGGALRMTNSTLTDNHAGISGGAIYNKGTAVLNYITVKDNTNADGTSLANAGIVNDAVANEFLLTNSYLDNNHCSGIDPADAANNVARSASGCQGVDDPSIVGLDPILDSDGKALAFAPPFGSTAINAAGAAGTICPATDQVGLSRPQFAACDIGAIELENVNDPPVASGDYSATTNEDVDVDIDVLANDNAGADDDDQSLTITAIFTPVNGTATINPITDPADPLYGTINFDPDPDYYGTGSFSYEVCDSGGLCSTADVVVTIIAVNDPPVANDDGSSISPLITDEDKPINNINVLANDYLGPENEREEETYTVSLDDSDLPTRGSTTLTGDGTITYVPDPNVFGPDTFSYKLCDNNGACDTAVVTIQINGVNDNPVAGEDNATTPEDKPVTIDIAANDSDVESDLDFDGSGFSFVQPANGTVSNNGNGIVTYTPNKHFYGEDSFQYTICDGDGGCDTATVKVKVTSDGYTEVTNLCDVADPTDPRYDGSLRWAINQANLVDETTLEEPTMEWIVFDLSSADCNADGTNTIDIMTELPPLLYPVIIDGLAVDPQGTFSHDPYTSAYITLNGGENDFSGITITSGASGSTITNLVIAYFGGSGIVIGDVGAPSSDNLISSNTINNNGTGDVPNGSISLNDGVTIIAGVNNELVDNNFVANYDQAVDLGGDGETPNDFGDPDEGANFVQNHPDIFRAGPHPDNNKLIIEGWLDSRPGITYKLQFFGSETCDSATMTLLHDDEIAVTTDPVTGYDAGIAYFSLTMPAPLQEGYAIRSTATDPNGNTSELSPCIRVGVGNDTWIGAMRLYPDENNTAAVDQYVDLFGQSRWYKIKVNPSNKVKVTLTNLPQNYDVVLFKDIFEAYEELTGPQDLNRLSAEFASDAVAPSALSPSALSPSALSPSALSPSALSPDEFAPSALSPSALSPSALSPSALSEDVISPSALSPSALSPSALSPVDYSPSALSPSALSPSALSPSALSADVYASAQSRSVIGVSAYEDVADETIEVSTWNNTGDFYIRVRGREGVFDPNAPFKLKVEVLPGACDALYNDPAFNEVRQHSLTIPTPADVGNKNTLILVDTLRMRDFAGYSQADVDAVMAKLNALTSPSLAEANGIKGIVVDVGMDDRVFDLNNLAQSYIECAKGKNLVADAIKEVIELYGEAGHNIEYIVLVGNDGIIPFYRYPDNALLGPESDYSPPAVNPSASFTSLESNMVLSQDLYGAEFGVSYKDDEIPIPKIPVGRLVEFPDEIITMIDAYLNETTNGLVSPQSSLVTGYDFLYDVALDVQKELEDGTANSATTLLTPSELSPLDPQSWTGPQLNQVLHQQRYDLMFLAGHFSANSALAADYATGLISTDLPNNDEIDLTNVIVFSAGCHSGYNIVFQDRYPGRTFEPDWAQAFAQRGATLIAGTGYQYGDTEFVEYSERIYLEFSRELRTGPGTNGSGAVAVGDALVKAKQTYLARTPVMRGIHEKAFLQATLFGLPFLKVDMPGERIVRNDNTSIINSTQAVATDPGATLDLRYAELTVTPSFITRTLEVRNIENELETELITATYFEGSDGVVTNPGEPVLPLESSNVAVDNLSLRGVGFLGGTYEDTLNMQPLVGAATTELRAIQLAFVSNVFFPLQPWSVNYFDALTGDGSETRFNVFPVQHLAHEPEPESTTLRKYNSLEFGLFYSDNVQAYSCDPELTECEENVIGVNQPALAAEPTIVSVTGTFNEVTNSVDFEVYVVANPGVGVQNVWVTYTAEPGADNDAFYGKWQSLDLTQAVTAGGDVFNSSLWTESLPLGDVVAEDVRFIVQAAGGNGLVSRADNVGRYYIPGGNVQRQPTSLELLNGPISGKVGQTAFFEAKLTKGNDPDTGEIFPGQLVGFGLGQEIRIVRTGPDGIARTSIPLLARPGLYQLTAWYLGNADNAPTTAVNPRDFTIFKQDTVISLDPPLATFSSPDEEIQMLAKLEDVEERPLAEKTVIFELAPRNGGETRYKAVITDLLGQARLGRVEGLLAGVTYDVIANFEETVSYFDPDTAATGVLKGNSPPICDSVVVTADDGGSELWPTNGKFTGIHLSNAYDADLIGPTDPDSAGYDVTGEALNYYFLDIRQDEPVDGEPDATISLYNTAGTPVDASSLPACLSATVRQERDGGGNGRVYAVDYLVTDGEGGSCQGTKLIATIPHDQGDDANGIDSGDRYYSLGYDGAAVDSCSPFTDFNLP